jgi:glycosyltransferase involved in cell wall biosynthesis
VSIVGFLTEPGYRQELARADVIVVSSRECAYPSGSTVLLHGMALSRACVATATSGLSTFLSPETVAAIPPCDAAAMRQAIVRLLSDGQHRDGLGRNARRWVEDNATLERQWEAIQGQLELICTP